MGYMTSYTLKVIRGDTTTNYKGEIGEISGYIGGPFDDTVKWYDHDKDMCLYSVRHPLTIFKIEGKGEENGDLWHKYYNNGNMIKECRAKIVYDEFDPIAYLRDNKIGEILS